MKNANQTIQGSDQEITAGAVNARLLTLGFNDRLPKSWKGNVLNLIDTIDGVSIEARLLAGLSFLTESHNDTKKRFIHSLRAEAPKVADTYPVLQKAVRDNDAVGFTLGFFRILNKNGIEVGWLASFSAQALKNLLTKNDPQGPGYVNCDTYWKTLWGRERAAGKKTKSGDQKGQGNSCFKLGLKRSALAVELPGLTSRLTH